MTTPAQKLHRVLVVDPDPTLSEILAVGLESEEWQIDRVEESAQGLSRLASAGYEAVVAETGLSRMDGFELMRCIRQAWPQTPVILTAARYEAADVLRALRDQAFCFLAKPVSASALGEAVLRAASSQDWRNDVEIVSARPEWITLDLRCKLEVVDRLLPFLRALKTELAEQDRDDCITAVRELLMNAIEHGGGSKPENKVRMALVRTSRAMIYYVCDPGKGFSFDHLPHAAISNPPESPLGHHEVRSEMGIRPGGFGILLTKSLVDELVYNETGNEVLVIKYLKP